MSGKAYKKLVKINQLIELEFDVPGSEVNQTESFSSRIEDLPGDNILVAAPFRKGTIVPVPVGKELRIHIRKDGIAHLLHTKVMERSKKIPRLLLAEPYRISRIQMRNWVRVDASLAVNYKMAGYDMDFFKSHTVDVSGGGLGLLAEHEIDKDTMLDLQVFLNNEYILQFNGLVTRCMPEKGRYVIGIEFKHISNRDQDSIVKFVFEKQREHISKRLIK